MTTLQEAAQQALDVLETTISSHGDIARSAINDLRAALEQPEQEPMAWMQKDGEHISLTQDEWHCIPLYTHPPRREWRSLSEEETKTLWDANGYKSAMCKPFVRAVEAALKERNV